MIGGFSQIESTSNAAVSGGLLSRSKTEQGLKSGHGLITPIMPKDKLIEVNLELGAADPMVGTDQPLLKVADSTVGQGHYRFGCFASPSGPPFRKLLDAGIPAGGGSDATNVAALNPWLMMYYMTTGKNNAGVVINPGQTISRLEALRLYTIGSAYLSFDDDKFGTIETGKLADLVVLSDDPLTVSDDKFRKLSSVMTLQAGKIIHGGAN